MKKQLLLGCGRNRNKKMNLTEKFEDWEDLTTLDHDPSVKPDIVFDLNEIKWPFRDNTFDEIHAYEVLEHLGTLGFYHGFFKDFMEIWRILKPNGHLIGTSPSLTSPWLFGDPGHTRVISLESLTFLDQESYKQIDKGSPLTDYRCLYKGNLKLVAHSFEADGLIFAYVMQAIK